MNYTDSYSADITEEQKAKLKELFPEVISEGKIDWKRLKATLGEEVDLGERYGLGWKGKSDVFRKIQEKTVSTLHPVKEESVDWDTTQNLFIEGDNLEALKVLHKAYYGKIKMIYIDPPYNTGNDFVYNDDFRQTKAEYEDEDTNVTRMDGLQKNTKDSGHYHSNWLNMMYPRLFLAKNLLRADGVIFISIDDNEVHNLTALCDEIFGEHNLVLRGIVNRTSEIATEHTIQKHEYFVAYARSFERLSMSGNEKYTVSRGTVGNADQTMPMIEFPAGLRCVNIPDGTYQNTRQIPGSSENIQNFDVITVENGRLKNKVALKARWRSSNDMRNFFANDCKPTKAKINGIIEEIYLEGDRFMPQIKKKTREKLSSLYLDNKRGSKDLEILNLANLMDYPKSVSYIKHLVGLSTVKDSIVLDFFSGSGTTAHAVMELNAEDGGNRTHIQVQLPEVISQQKAGLGEYKTIPDISKERIRRAGKKISENFTDKISKRKVPFDVGFRVYKLGDSNFKKWNELVGDEEGIRQQMFDHLDPLEPNTTDEDLLTEILLKRGISPIVKIETNDDFHFIPSENIAISLAKTMTQEIFDKILAKNPSQIILLDQSFKNNLNLKTNLILQAEKQNINIEAI